jgi:acetyl esterase/lipase
MFEALQAAGVRTRLFTAEGAPHTFWSNAKWYGDWQREMEEFLRPLLNPH